MEIREAINDHDLGIILKWWVEHDKEQRTEGDEEVFAKLERIRDTMIADIKEIDLPEPFNNTYGTWHVTTEGDEEGRTVRDLGIHKGYIDEIAYKLSGEAYYGLEFSPPPPPKEPLKPKDPKHHVHIHLDIKSKTWDLTKEKRANTFRVLFQDRPVVVTESKYHASVKLTFTEHARMEARRLQETAKELLAEADYLQEMGDLCIKCKKNKAMKDYTLCRSCST
jgi:hypothetical protein